MSYRLLSGLPILFLTFVALVPATWTAGPWLESRYFPVIENVQVHDETLVDGGVEFTVSFDKVRQCTFVGLYWHDAQGRRLSLDFLPDRERQPYSRPRGPQRAGPWVLEGVSQIDGTRAVAHHRCHPLWDTYSRF